MLELSNHNSRENRWRVQFIKILVKPFCHNLKNFHWQVPELHLCHITGGIRTEVAANLWALSQQQRLSAVTFWALVLCTFLHHLFPNRAHIFAQQMAVLGLLHSTLCRSVIRTHIELHQTGTIEGRSTDWATAPQLRSLVLSTSYEIQLTALFCAYHSNHIIGSDVKFSLPASARHELSQAS